MNTFDLKIFRILFATCSVGFVLFYLFPFLLVLPALLLVGVVIKGKWGGDPHAALKE